MHELHIRCTAFFSYFDEKMLDRPKGHLSSAIRTPQPISALAILPKLDGTVFTASGVELAVGRVADAPDGTVMTFVDIQLRLSLVIVQLGPSILCASSNRSSLDRVQRTLATSYGRSMLLIKVRASTPP